MCIDTCGSLGLSRCSHELQAEREKFNQASAVRPINVGVNYAFETSSDSSCKSQQHGRRQIEDRNDDPFQKQAVGIRQRSNFVCWYESPIFERRADSNYSAGAYGLYRGGKVLNSQTGEWV